MSQDPLILDALQASGVNAPSDSTPKKSSGTSFKPAGAKRVDRHNNPIAVMAHPQFSQILEQKGVPHEQGDPFPQNEGGSQYHTISFPTVQDGRSGAKAILANSSSAFNWYKKTTGKKAFEAYPQVQTPQDFFNLSDPEKEDFVDKIAQAEGTSGKVLSTNTDQDPLIQNALKTLDNPAPAIPKDAATEQSAKDVNELQRISDEFNREKIGGNVDPNDPINPNIQEAINSPTLSEESIRAQLTEGPQSFEENKPGALEAFATRALNTASFGLGTKAAPTAKTLFDTLGLTKLLADQGVVSETDVPSVLVGEKPFGEQVDLNRELAEEEFRRQAMNHPAASALGSLAGVAKTPKALKAKQSDNFLAAMIKNVLEGGRAGAAVELGGSLDATPKSVAASVGTGAGLGGAVGFVGQAAKKPGEFGLDTITSKSGTGKRILEQLGPKLTKESLLKSNKKLLTKETKELGNLLNKHSGLRVNLPQQQILGKQTYPKMSADDIRDLANIYRRAKNVPTAKRLERIAESAEPKSLNSLIKRILGGKKPLNTISIKDADFLVTKIDDLTRTKVMGDMKAGELNRVMGSWANQFRRSIRGRLPKQASKRFDELKGNIGKGVDIQNKLSRQTQLSQSGLGMQAIRGILREFGGIPAFSTIGSIPRVTQGLAKTAIPGANEFIQNVFGLRKDDKEKDK